MHGDLVEFKMEKRKEFFLSSWVETLTDSSQRALSKHLGI